MINHAGLQTKEMNEVEDHKITVVGPEVDEMEEGSKDSLSTLLEVAGKKMQPDFEPVIERKFHTTSTALRMSYHTVPEGYAAYPYQLHDAFDAGFRTKHIGDSFTLRLKRNEFEAIVDKVW